MQADPIAPPSDNAFPALHSAAGSLPDDGACVHSCCGDRTQVIDTRPTTNGLRRRRRCNKCGNRYSTMEIFMPLDGDHIGITNDISMITALPPAHREGVRAMLKLLTLKPEIDK